MVRIGRRYAAATIAAAVCLGVGTVPATAGESDGDVSAYLDGKRIPLSDVGRYYCDDFAYPVIRCSLTPLVPQARATMATLLAGADYVTIYDQTSYQGAYMNVSQNWDALVTIGWNDRVSSFKGRNSATGKFWSDWFYGGSYRWFCCNQSVSWLGASDNTFSSVQRT